MTATDDPPSTIVICIDGPITRGDVATLCENLRRALAANPVDVVVYDVGSLVDPDLVAVDALARLQLTAKRHGCSIRLRHADDELRALLALVGLRQILPVFAALSGELQGQAEVREQLAVEVDEVVQVDDPPT